MRYVEDVARAHRRPDAKNAGRERASPPPLSSPVPASLPLVLASRG